MPILSKKEIERRINAGELVRDPSRDDDGNPVVEFASYDLRAGIVLWKDGETDKIIQLNFDETKDSLQQGSVTLLPGQMVFVITHEELKLPVGICGTVYSRNRLQKANILALNAGHVDPGFEGPIIIRLINLAAIPWSLPLGEAVFTVVFHTVKPEGPSHPPITKKQTLEAARKTAEGAFSNPFHDLYKAQIKEQLGEYYSQVMSDLRKEFHKEFFPRDQILTLAVAVTVGIVTLLALIARLPWRSIWNWLTQP
jgi:deoxycytidine triphosphate deaminase